MAEASIIVGVVLACLAAVYCVPAGLFLRALTRPQPRPTTRDLAPTGERSLPPVAILLALRGAHPRLADHLQRLLAQDYPRFELHIVVDSTDDPAWQLVQELEGSKRGRPKVRVSALEFPRATCSLKCSALVQMVGDLDGSVGAIALTDADVATHPGWLRELIEPLRNPHIGLVTGLPWPIPAAATWGSLVVHLWNMPSAVFMWLSDVVWGGTCALRVETLQACGVVGRWQRSLSSDVPLGSAVRELGLRVRCVPQLVMVSREDCGLSTALQRIKRYLSTVRFHHHHWGLLWVHAVIPTAAFVAAILIAIVGLATRQLEPVAWAGGGAFVYWISLSVLANFVDRSVRRHTSVRGQPTPHPPWAGRLKVAVAVLLAHGVHLAAMGLATFDRFIVWSGVTYEVRGPWDVRVRNHPPSELHAETLDRDR